MREAILVDCLLSGSESGTTKAMPRAGIKLDILFSALTQSMVSIAGFQPNILLLTFHKFSTEGCLTQSRYQTIF